MTARISSPVAITMGDPGGIGGELSIKVWLERAQNKIPPYFLIDDPVRLSTLAERLGISLAIQEITAPGQALQHFNQALPVFPITVPNHDCLGRGDPANARAVIDSIDRAINLCRTGKAGAMVTNPIHKASLYEAAFLFPGHTEYLAHKCADLHETPMPVMMLTCSDLRVVLATIHLPLRDVADSLTEKLITEKLRTTAHSLQQDFGIARPRISVAALNPHAGEEGALGTEELQVLKPAIDRLKAEGLNVAGPFPADTLFHKDARRTYDAVLCMYHDQALIPVKSLDFYGGVNVTLGLPIVRTSPDHGTAFDIAGTNKANPSSLTKALLLAGDIAHTRASHGRSA